MAEHTLAELDKVVAKRGKAFRSAQTQRYHLARELGFSAAQAAVLQNWSEKAIRQLAAERKTKPN